MRKRVIYYKPTTTAPSPARTLAAIATNGPSPVLMPRSTLDPAALDVPVGLAVLVPVPLLLAAGLPVAEVLMPEEDPVPVGADDEPEAVLVTPVDVPVGAAPETVSAAA